MKLGDNIIVKKTVQVRNGGNASLAQNAMDLMYSESHDDIVQVLADMQRLGDSAEQVQKGCVTLTQLARGSSWDCMSIVSAGGIPVIISAMTRHGAVSAVAESGCKVLANLSCNSANCLAIRSAGGIDVIVSAMTRHKNVAAVAENGCNALRNLSLESDNLVAIAFAGGISAIISAMTRHGDVAGVAADGCWALRHLAFGNDRNRHAIASAGGITAIVSAMSRHGMSVENVLGDLAFHGYSSVVDEVALAVLDTLEEWSDVPACLVARQYFLGWVERTSTSAVRVR